MTAAWPARLSTTTAGYLRALPPDVQETVRDLLDIASRDPWSWPQWDPADAEGGDLRAAGLGPLTVVYWINREHGHLWIIDIQWIG